MNKILLVDDDEDILETMTLVLELGGYKVLGLLKAVKIEQEIQKFKPDLIVLDIVIGHLDGRSICVELKRNPLFRHLPILMMSGLYSAKDVLNKDGCPDDFLSKPFDIAVFVERVSRLIASKKAIDYNIN